jgi:uncharacterized membrane protein
MLKKLVVIRQAALVSFATFAPFVAHFLLVREEFGGAAMGLVLVQAAIVGWLIHSTARPPYRQAALLGLAVCLIAVCLLHRRGSLALASGVPHALIYLGLLGLFGISLLPGREPLATYFARRIHGTLTPEIIRYTRYATAAWCIFFVLQIAGSALLILFAPIAWWSTFVNILNVPLLVGMFVAERLVRPFLLAGAPHESLSDMRQMADLMRSRNPFKRRPGLS